MRCSRFWEKGVSIVLNTDKIGLWRFRAWLLILRYIKVDLWHSSVDLWHGRVDLWPICGITGSIWGRSGKLGSTITVGQRIFLCRFGEDAKSKRVILNETKWNISYGGSMVDYCRPSALVIVVQNWVWVLKRDVHRTFWVRVLHMFYFFQKKKKKKWSLIFLF